MSPQSNSIYLSYSQDAVRRLPLAIASGLRQQGYDVFMDMSHFRRFEPPPQRILEQIESHKYFMLLLTPASVRYGFNFGEERLEYEIKYARQIGCSIVVIFAYGLEVERTLSHWSLEPILAHDITTIVLDEVNIETLLDNLNAILRPNLESTSLAYIQPYEKTYPMPGKAQLQAEHILDKGLTEEYDSISNNRPSEAIDYFNKALDTDSEYAEAYFQRAEFMYRERFSRRKKFMLSEAELLVDYDRAIILAPQEPRYYDGRARIGNKEMAISDYTNAIYFAPEYADYYESRGSVYSICGDLDAAITDYSMAIQLKPNNAHYYIRRSSIYRQKGNDQLALIDMNTAIELDHSDRDYVARGFLHADMKEFEKAEADWNHAIEISSRPAGVYALKAQLHNHRHEFDEALKAAEAALQLDPNHKMALRIKDDILKSK
jgi:tetratricopeptide (TPR) repeat protein